MKGKRCFDVEGALKFDFFLLGVAVLYDDHVTVSLNFDLTMGHNGTTLAVRGICEL